MIRIRQQDSAQAAKEYYSKADYYSEGQEIVGSWGGKGASRLGLQGTVDKFSFERLCDNLDPRTGKALTVRTRAERRVGYDVTFSVPKSVSLLYATSGDQGIMDAFRGAVDETMREMEAEMKTRVRKKGQDTDRTTGNMIWAEFIHTTSRPVDGIPDPQLHAHCFVFNATFCDEERRWKAGQFADLKRDAPYFQAAFRVRLANKLQDLGFGIERKRDDFEIAGIPKDVLGRFSRRTALIEKVAKEKGISDPDRKGELGAETREKKGARLSWDRLRKEWNARLSEQERQVLAAVHRREHTHARPVHAEMGAVDYAIEHSFVREAVVPERKLVTEALKRGLGAVTVEDVTREVADRPLIRKDVEGRSMATTKLMRDMEKRLIEFARDGRGRCRPMGDPKRTFKRDWLNEDQKNAIRATLASRDRVCIIRGVAGSGKTTLEQELGEAIIEAGRPVVAIAQSSTASRGVLREEAGFAHADTVAMFLKDQKHLQESARNGVILVDEASQLGTRDMNRLFDVAESVGARIVLVGDKRQHRAVVAGEPLRLLEDKAGLRAAEVKKILRQTGDYKKAAEALSEGRVADAFTQLDKLGWIKEFADGERYQQLADAYLSIVSEKKRGDVAKTAIVVSPTWAEVNQVQAAIRNALKEQGKLRNERIVKAWLPAHLTDAQKADTTQYEAGDMIQFHQNAPGHTRGSRLIVGDGVTIPTELAKRFEVYRPTEFGLAVGDRLRITAGGKTQEGKRLDTGMLTSVRGFTKRGDIIVDQGTIDAGWGHVALGYGTTSHSVQGVTVDEVCVGLSSQSFPGTSERTGYVALTRGKQRVQIFTDSKEELLKALCRPDDPMSATELSGTQKKPPGLLRQLAHRRGLHIFGSAQQGKDMSDRGLDHAG